MQLEQTSRPKDREARGKKEYKYKQMLICKLLSLPVRAPSATYSFQGEGTLILSALFLQSPDISSRRRSTDCPQRLFPLSQIPATAAGPQHRCQQGHERQESGELGPVCVPGCVGVQASASPHHASAPLPLWGISKEPGSTQLATQAKQVQ